jgi:hypothetical protein
VPDAVVASALSPQELDELREELQAQGAATEGFDDAQLLELRRRLEQGLPMFAGEAPAAAVPAEVVASALSPQELDELREALQAQGTATEGLDDAQLLELTHGLSQGLSDLEVPSHSD